MRSLQSSHSHFNIIGKKRELCLKTNLDGFIALYKAQLVAKGFHQHPIIIDYKDTFNPIIKLQTIKKVVCISLSKCWYLMQMNVNNAFLTDTLS